MGHYASELGLTGPHSDLEAFNRFGPDLIRTRMEAGRNYLLVAVTSHKSNPNDFLGTTTADGLEAFLGERRRTERILEADDLYILPAECISTRTLTRAPLKDGGGLKDPSGLVGISSWIYCHVGHNQGCDLESITQYVTWMSRWVAAREVPTYVQWLTEHGFLRHLHGAYYTTDS